MKESLLVGLLSLSMAVPVWALDYTAQGKVVAPVLAYAGPGFDSLDTVGAGASVASVALVISTNADWVAPVAVLTYGAYRTAKYRPAAIKAQIHANVTANAQAARPGSIQEVLGL
mgnify:CR=1 FL=1